jgi:RimJ/RimL family protein N-acetyltransferase
VIGIFQVSAHNRVAWELHQGFLPEAIRAGYPLPAAIAFREWIWSNSECQRLFGWIVKSNRLALRFAKRAGMKVCGINERSFLKDGVVQDQLLVGISRPEGR